ncbi:MAG: extradiol dioxygenase [Acidobacteria bacterium]|nr:extradiol dioxygenase [Acidobacteriota bacterium]MCI0568998.1 extradiol dioxygenase [Acidobacteriota bacterium]
MIQGAHVLLYSNDPEADRAFFRDILRLRWVDAGEGWLIFKLPPAEVAFHPSEGDTDQVHAEHPLLGGVLYLMCDDLNEAIASLKAKKVKCSRVMTAPWGKVTTFKLPSGGKIGLYQPQHPTAINLRSK